MMSVLTFACAFAGSSSRLLALAPRGAVRCGLADRMRMRPRTMIEPIAIQAIEKLLHGESLSAVMNEALDARPNGDAFELLDEECLLRDWITGTLDEMKPFRAALDRLADEQPQFAEELGMGPELNPEVMRRRASCLLAMYIMKHGADEPRDLTTFLEEDVLAVLSSALP